MGTRGREEVGNILREEKVCTLLLIYITYLAMRRF